MNDRHLSFKMRRLESRYKALSAEFNKLKKQYHAHKINKVRVHDRRRGGIL